MSFIIVDETGNDSEPFSVSQLCAKFADGEIDGETLARKSEEPEDNNRPIHEIAELRAVLASAGLLVMIFILLLFFLDNFLF